MRIVDTEPPTVDSVVTSRRLLKAAEAIREVVASSILTELRDPRVRDVTVVGVTVSPDMREAKVAVSIMGETPDGATLPRVETLKSDVFWFIWANFHRDTDVNRLA